MSVGSYGSAPCSFAKKRSPEDDVESALSGGLKHEFSVSTPVQLFDINERPIGVVCEQSACRDCVRSKRDAD